MIFITSSGRTDRQRLVYGWVNNNNDRSLWSEWFQWIGTNVVLWRYDDKNNNDDDHPKTRLNGLRLLLAAQSECLAWPTESLDNMGEESNFIRKPHPNRVTDCAIHFVSPRIC